MLVAFIGISGFYNLIYNFEREDSDCDEVRNYLGEDMAEITRFLAIEACPEALAVADNDGAYPMHYAYKWFWKEPKLIQMLLEANPQSACVHDNYGDFPFHRL